MKMASWEYAAALIAILTGTLLLRRALRLPQLHGWRLAKTLLVIGLLFTLLDILAVSRGWWSFNLAKTFGVMIANQPLEEVAFFLIAPFFYLALWQAVQPRGKTK